MSKKYGYILLGILILLIITVITATSYSLWNSSFGTEMEQVVNLGCFSVSYQSKNEISLKNTYPIPDSDGLNSKPFEFTVTNSGCEIDSLYSIVINSLPNNMQDSWIKVAYQIDDGEVSTPKVLTQYEDAETFDNNATAGYLLTSGYLVVGETINVKVWLWLDNGVGNEAQNKEYNAKIYVYNQATYLPGVDMLIAKANKDDITSYDDSKAKKSEMFKFVHDETEQVTDINQLTDYRFIGGGSYCLYSSDVSSEDVKYRTDENGECPETLYNQYYITSPGLYGTTYYGYFVKNIRTHGSTTEETLETLTLKEKVTTSLNNYMKFNCDKDRSNCEVWRIIGVFTDTDGKKNIKIIKDESVGIYDFDGKSTNVGSSLSWNGSNDWTDAQLMYALNGELSYIRPGYQNIDGTIFDSSNNLIYKMGYIPHNIFDGAAIYSSDNKFNWKLKDTSRRDVDDVTYYLGQGSATNVENYYSVERSNTIYTSVNLPFERTRSLSSYVGLMYPSDYGYTYAYGVDNVCYNNMGVDCSRFGSSTASWLNNINETRWTITPDSSYEQVSISKTGGLFKDVVGEPMLDAKDDGEENVYGGHTYLYEYGYDRDNTELNEKGMNSVNPVVYLKSEIVLTGLGTIESPYEIVY